MPFPVSVFFLGVKALTRVGAADWSYWLALWAVCTLTQGFSIPISQSFGEGNYGAVRKLTAASICLSLIGAAASLILAVLCIRKIRHLPIKMADKNNSSQTLIR